MLLKHKVGCFFCSLDSTVLISIFAGFNMFESFCVVSCCYVALFVAVKLQDVLKDKVGFFFSFFRRIQLS